jgi:putative ABC transport system permease protein
MVLVDSVRSSIRSLVHAPRFALTVAGVLALGIGLSTAVFTVADALLVRRLPMRDQNSLITLWAQKRGDVEHWPLDLRTARRFARRTRALRSVGYVAHEGAWPVAVRDGDQLTRLRRALVSGNYFDVLGARPLLGRTLQPADDVVGAAPVAVISYDTWQQRFGGDPDVLTKRLTLAEFGITYAIVGVMPAGLEYPAATEFWAPFVPARLHRDPDTTAYTALDLVGRLAPGATMAGAEAELTAFYARNDASPNERDMRGVAHPLPRVILGDVRPAVLAFGAAAALLLLLACMNVANLLLVRGLARMREIAVRAALGASRTQLVVQLLGENLVLAAIGGVLGVGVAEAAVRGFLAVAPLNIPLLDRVRLNGAALLGALGITTVAALLFGLAPAVLQSGADALAALRSGTRLSSSRRSRLAREALVSAQLALAVVVLSAAALLGRSFMNLQHAALNFDDRHLLIAELAIRYDQYGTPTEQLPLVRELLAQLRVTPGIAAVSPVVAMPFSGAGGWTGHARVDGQSPAQTAKNPAFNMDVVTPEYFSTFGLRLVRGRAFTEADRAGTEPVVVISEGTARRYWPAQDPLGKHLLMGDSPGQTYTVVGVVPDTRYRALREAPPSVDFPLAQSTFPFAPTTLAIRTSGSPAALVPTIRRVIDGAVPGVRLASAAPFDTYLRGPLAQPRLNSLLLAVFAIAAMLLAAIGVYAVMATMVRQRAHEIGVRMALGATAGDVRRMVAGRGLAMTSIGVAFGGTGALFATRAVSSLLYHVSPTDMGTLIGVVLALTAVGMLATWAPAERGARADPATALRADT